MFSYPQKQPPEVFIKIEALAQVFSYEFCEISKNTFFTEHAWATAPLPIIKYSNLFYLGWQISFLSTMFWLSNFISSSYEVTNIAVYS